MRVGLTSPDDGILTTIGSLGVDVSNLVGFDIAPGSNVAFASLQFPGEAFSRLTVVNLANGRVTSLGSIGGRLLRDIAVDTRGTSGFFSSAGFGVGAIPPPVFTVSSPGSNATGFTAHSLFSQFGTPVPTTPLFRH